MNKEVAVAHVDKFKGAALQQDPRIRVLTLRPNSLLFASFSKAFGGPPGSWTSPVAIPLSECVSAEGEIQPSVLWSIKDQPGFTQQDFDEDKDPIVTY